MNDALYEKPSFDRLAMGKYIIHFDEQTKGRLKGIIQR